jgi:hypothetical protein
MACVMAQPAVPSIAERQAQGWDLQTSKKPPLQIMARIVALLYCTVRVTVVECDNAPEVAVTVRV